MSIDEIRAKSHAIWEEMAAGWEARSDFLYEAGREAAEWMVQRLEPQPGQTILELAAGPGMTGFLAAKMIGEQGLLISTDFSTKMLDVAKDNAVRLELTNVDFREMDAEKIALDDESVDGVLCRWGYMLMMDPIQALKETHRVLKPGGRVAFSVWGTPAQNPWASLAGMVMVSLGKISLPDPHAPGSIFSMGEPETVEGMIQEAGFTKWEIEPIGVSWTFEDEEELWAFYRDIAGAISLLLREMDESSVQEVRKAILDQSEVFRIDGRYVMPGVTVNAVASKG